MVNGLLFHMTQPTSRSIIKAIVCSKPTIIDYLTTALIDYLIINKAKLILFAVVARKRITHLHLHPTV